MGNSVLWLACVLLVAAAAGLASGAEEQLSKAGGFEPIEYISNPAYQNVGKKIVETMNNREIGYHLQFLEVVCGWYQVLGVVRYKLCLKVIDEDNNNAVVYYETFVHEELRYLDILNFQPVPNLIQCCSPPQAKAIA